jgi:hypothetical protein
MNDRRTCADWLGLGKGKKVVDQEEVLAKA